MFLSSRRGGDISDAMSPLPPPVVVLVTTVASLSFDNLADFAAAFLLDAKVFELVVCLLRLRISSSSASVKRGFWLFLSLSFHCREKERYLDLD
jgi:hypothetical protein